MSKPLITKLVGTEAIAGIVDQINQRLPIFRSIGLIPASSRKM
jgi:hypothetical protein